MAGLVQAEECDHDQGMARDRKSEGEDFGLLSNILRLLARELPVLRQAPISITVLTLVFSTLVCGALWYFNLMFPSFVVTSLKSQTANAESRNALLQTQIDSYRHRLEGASPEEAQAELLQLRARVEAIGVEINSTRWQPLSAAVIASLVADMKAIPARKVDILILDADGRALAQSLQKVFSDASWPVRPELDRPLGWEKEGVWIGPDDDGVRKAKSIIEIRTGLVLTLFPSLPGPEPELSIVVGHKPK